MLHAKRTTVLRFAFALASATVLAACGGGGGGSSPGPVPTATATPTPVPSPTAMPTGIVTQNACQTTTTPAGATASVFTITASPAISVLVDGSPIGITPQTQTLSQCRSTTAFAGGAPHQITFNALLPYMVPVVQQDNGARIVYFNGVSDTLANARMGSPVQGVTRAPQGRAAAIDASTIRRPLSASYHPGDVVLDRFYVKSAKTAIASARLRQLDANRAIHVSDFGSVDATTVARVVTIASGADLQSAMAAYRRVEGVTDVQPIHYRRIMSTVAQMPMDTYFDPYDQWDMFQIGAPNAWGYSKGAGATIAVIDTGSDSNQADIGPVGTTKLTYAETVINGATTVGPTVDNDGHGTNVAGIAGAATNNNFGFAGVGYNVFLQAYKVISGASGTTADEAQAIRDAVAHGADVINLSLGGSDFDQMEHDAVEFAISQNVVVVAAAGNCGYASGSDCNGAISVLDYPAGYDGVISVGATGYNDSNPTGVMAGTYTPGGVNDFVAGYSQSGPNLSLVAPGGGNRSASTPGDITNTADNDFLHWIFNIYSTTANQPCTKIADCKALFVGTSQATPHVAGAAALLVAAAGGHGKITPAQVASILESTADDIKDLKQGHGRLNVYRALAALTGDPILPNYVPSSSQFVAFAYANTGFNVPTILDVNYPQGVPVARDGTFRIADVNSTTLTYGNKTIPAVGPYKIAVWYDANGNGKIDAGDEFGVAAGPACNANYSGCTPGTITVSRVGATFQLP